MRKLSIQGLLIIASFFSTWFFLQQVDWMHILKIDHLTETTEKKLGDLFWDIFKKSDREIQNQFVINPVDSLVSKLCVDNNIPGDRIKIHVLDKDEINAFALPDGHIIIYSGLILDAENPEELIGVIGHEIAHVELDHVMKKLIKEIGLSVLVSMTTGGSGSEVIKETTRILSSSAFDRSLEKEADLKAVEYLAKAGIATHFFADFLNRLAKDEDKTSTYLSWISSHPDSKGRSEYILEQGNHHPVRIEPVLTQETWNKLHEVLKE